MKKRLSYSKHVLLEESRLGTIAALEKPANNHRNGGAAPSLRVGLFGIGLDAYWPQFKGLKNRLEGYLQVTSRRLARPGVKVVDLGLVDTPAKALEAGHQFRRGDVDLIFLHVTTYALSSTVLPVVQRAKVPVIILNLSPAAAIDYEKLNNLGDRTAMTGEWLAHCGACPVPEIANVFNRARIPFYQITGMLHDDPSVWNEVDAWLEAARVANVMFQNRLGVMGHYYGGMLDIYSDFTQHCATFGGHIDVIEVDELAALRREVTGKQIESRVREFKRYFDIQSDCARAELERAARTSVALDRLVAAHNLGSLAYYYRGTGQPENEDAISSIILGNSLLTARGIPVAGEYEIKNVQAMKIMDTFGAGGSFTEYYAMDFNDDVVLMGHDGPGHISIAQGKTRVRPLQVYHGKVGRGLSVEMCVKHGPVTVLSVVQTVDGKLKFLMAEGESVAGPILKIGNTNSRYRFSLGARKFVESWNVHGPAHHCAIGVGHLTGKLQKLAALLGIDAVRVC
ncbi:MAG TPA: arabinose isomerase [Verrucomicrobiae bacterium]|nr:arabinose isomerase [Verrucomicrobiae bacterium]